MIRVLIADDHAIVRGGLKEILVHHLEDVVCGEAENAEQVLAQVRYVSQALAEQLAQDLQESDDRPVHETLSAREFEILVMIGSGKTVSQIAEELHLSVTTVSTYRARVLKKMNMATTAELMRYALRNHLVD